MTLAGDRRNPRLRPVEAALDLMTESALDVTMVLHYASDDAVRDDRRPPAPARRLGRHLRCAAASAALRHGAAIPRPVLAAGGPRSPPRRRSPASRRAPQIASAPDRGRIAPGKRADLVLLDPAALCRHRDVCGPRPVAGGRARRLGGRNRRSGGRGRRPAPAPAASSADAGAALAERPPSFATVNSRVPPRCSSQSASAGRPSRTASATPGRGRVHRARAGTGSPSRPRSCS